MTDRYAVMGNPVAHSKSPWIHRQFAEQTGQDLVYEAILVATDGFAEAVDAFRASGGKGLNITVPFKQDAFRYAGTCSPRAQRAAAVNTLHFRDDGSCFGDNTDGIGLLRDILINQEGSIAFRRILVVGAGGACRGIVGPLLEEDPAEIVIANRTAEKAVALAAEFASPGKVFGCGFNELEGDTFDLVINATSASLHDEVPALPDGLFSSHALCYDLMYQAEPTVFMQWGLAQGAQRAADGLGMLVEQAAESFFLWRGVHPETAPVLAGLRALLQQG